MVEVTTPSPCRSQPAQGIETTPTHPAQDAAGASTSRSQCGHHTIGGRKICNQESGDPAGAVRRPDVLHQLPGPHGHLLRRPQRHEHGPGPRRGPVRLRLRRLLHRLHPARGPQQPGPAQVRRPPLAGPHHGQLGHRLPAVHLGRQRGAALHPALHPRRGRGRLLPRRHPLPEPLGSVPAPQQDPCPLLPGPAADHRHRCPAGRPPHPAARPLRPRRLARHVLRRRRPRHHRRHHRLVLPR